MKTFDRKALQTINELRYVPPLRVRRRDKYLQEDNPGKILAHAKSSGIPIWVFHSSHEIDVVPLKGIAILIDINNAGPKGIKDRYGIERLFSCTSYAQTWVKGAISSSDASSFVSQLEASLKWSLATIIVTNNRQWERWWAFIHRSQKRDPFGVRGNTKKIRTHFRRT